MSPEHEDERPADLCPACWTDGYWRQGKIVDSRRDVRYGQLERHRRRECHWCGTPWVTKEVDAQKPKEGEGDDSEEVNV